MRLLALCLFMGIAAADVPANLEPAGPAMVSGTPVMYFGVEACGTKVFWLVMDSGKMFRLDRDHHPKDMEGFMRSIEQLPNDLVVIPCATAL